VRGFGRRFAVEVGFIVLVAVGLAVTHLRWPAIVGLMGAAWVLTAIVEFVAWRHGREQASKSLERAVASPESGAPGRGSHLRALEPPPDWPPAWKLEREPEPGGEAAPAPLEPRVDSKPEPELEPVAVEAEPEPEPVAAEAEPEPGLEPVAVKARPESELEPVAVEAEPEPEPLAIEAEPEPEPAPEPLAIEPEPEPALEPVAGEAGPEPELEAEPIAPEPEVAEPEPAAARAWNIWELDNLAKDASEEHREELSYLLVYLRDFASPEGVLPTDFDALVRESFGDLLAAGAL
jgi:hypothetical protein